MKILKTALEIVRVSGYLIMGLFNYLYLKIKNLISSLKAGFKKFSTSGKNLIKKKQNPKNKKALKKKETLVKKDEKTPTIKFITPFILGIIFCLLFVFLPIEITSWFKQLPSPELLVIDGSRRNTKILDRNGKLLYEIYVDQSFDPVKLDRVPDYVKKATIAAEDAGFYSHKGIDIKAVARASKEILFDKNLQGGSTITQQLVKNVLLSPERTLSRKIKEAVLALLVEGKYSKDQILEMYLNNTPYGGTAWGIEAASKKYFGKDVWDLNLAEAALLAGLPSSPTVNSPLYNLDQAKERQKYVLEKMTSLNFITQEESENAQKQQLVLISQNEYIRAPHFVNFVRNELVKKYGKRAVELGGLTVRTTLDLDLQEKVQNIVRDEVEKNGGYLGFSNAAAVVLEPKTGGILAYVGSVDYFKEKWGSYDVATAFRQPGSSVKPVTYALALSGKYTLASVIEDTEISYKQNDGKVYTPVNYDGKFHGKVTLRQALANSYNIPAVKIADSVGPNNIVSLGRELGFTNWQVGNDYGLSVTLGGKEVRLLDITNVFATFSRKGIYKEANPFLDIWDGRGFKIDGYPGEEKRVISDEVSYLIWSVLSDNSARVPAFGPNSYLVVPKYTVAVKTGTTDNKKDNWTVGFTPSYAVGVWVGNNDGKPMNPYLASGLSGAAPIWNKIFRAVLEGKTNEVPAMPAGVYLKFDDKCNKSEYFIKGSNVPESLCGDNGDSKEKSKKGKD